EVVDHIPDPRFPVEGACSFPYGFDLGGEVEEEHVVARDGVEQGFDLWRLPEFSVAVEQPALHDPGGIGVGLAHAGVYFAAEAGEIGRVVRRWFVLIEGVGGIEMVGTEEGGLCRQKFLADLREKRVGGIEEVGVVESIFPVSNLAMCRWELPGEGRRDMTGKGWE